MNGKNLMLPGLRAPAVFTFLLALCAPAQAQTNPQTVAQQQRTAQPSSRVPIAARPVPTELELAKLVWSTTAMIDHANRSGNYSVLRDSSATGFQINNDPARLTQVFAGLRAARIDLSNALVVAPTYVAPPQLVQADVFRVQGYFPLRPRAIFFDYYFQWQNGDWRLFGVSVEPREMVDGQKAR